MKEQSLIRCLSFLSFGLGAAELLAPRQVARCVGLNQNRDSLIRLLGLREIISGLGLLQGKSNLFLWSRVAGDAMDLAFLGAAMRSPENDRRRLNTAFAAVAGIAAIDVVASMLCSRDHADSDWRVNDSDTYAAGFERGDPAALRACCDEAMTEHAKAVFHGDRDFPAHRASTVPTAANALDELAGHDDGLEQTASPA
jgi:hypothetical protein